MACSVWVEMGKRGIAAVQPSLEGSENTGVIAEVVVHRNKKLSLSEAKKKWWAERKAKLRGDENAVAKGK